MFTPAQKHVKSKRGFHKTFPVNIRAISLFTLVVNFSKHILVHGDGA